MYFEYQQARYLHQVSRYFCTNWETDKRWSKISSTRYVNSKHFNWLKYIAHPLPSSRICRSKVSSSNLSGRVIERDGAQMASMCMFAFFLPAKSLIFTSTWRQSWNRYLTFIEYILTTPKSRYPSTLYETTGTSSANIFSVLRKTEENQWGKAARKSKTLSTAWH